jgi:hypothetical protein
MLGNCSIPNCNRRNVVIVRKMCGRHYQYQYRHGTPEIANHPIAPLKISKGWAMWLAAVLDCEGWIGMMQSTRSNGIAYWASIGVGNTNPKLIKTLRRLTRIGCISKSDRGRHNKPIYMWTVTKYEHVRSLLLAVIPHLLLKRRQAEIILSLPPKNTRANALKRKLKTRLSALNRKGIR